MTLQPQGETLTKAMEEPKKHFENPVVVQSRDESSSQIDDYRLVLLSARAIIKH